MHKTVLSEEKCSVYDIGELPCIIETLKLVLIGNSANAIYFNNIASISDVAIHIW